MALVLVIFLVSCKAKAILADSNTKPKRELKETLDAAKIIQKNALNKKDFTTVYIKSTAHYEDDKQNQNVSAEIKIKKEEMILISIRFIGITVAKALITPTEVKYYEKINGSYFEGDFSLLSQWLGTDLNFDKVQNLLLGQTLDDLKDKKLITTIEDKTYKLEDTSDSNTTKTYFFETDKFLIKKQLIAQAMQERMLQILYPEFTEINQTVMPTNIIIDAVQKEKKTNISIEYTTVSFNEELTFPYSVPSGYERIYMN